MIPLPQVCKRPPFPGLSQEFPHRPRRSPTSLSGLRTAGLVACVPAARQACNTRDCAKAARDPELRHSARRGCAFGAPWSPGPACLGLLGVFLAPHGATRSPLRRTTPLRRFLNFLCGVISRSLAAPPRCEPRAPGPRRPSLTARAKACGRRDPGCPAREWPGPRSSERLTSGETHAGRCRAGSTGRSPQCTSAADVRGAAAFPTLHSRRAGRDPNPPHLAGRRHARAHPPPEEAAAAPRQLLRASGNRCSFLFFFKQKKYVKKKCLG